MATISKLIAPVDGLEVLSQHEVSRLRDSGAGGLQGIFRRSALAVLNCDDHVDDAMELMNMYKDFTIEIVQHDQGVKLALQNAPANAFVDGKIIHGVRKHLFAVLRDTLFIHGELAQNTGLDLNSSAGITNFVFHILRNADVLRPKPRSDIAVCWGGHSIKREEYQYTKDVGYQLGLRNINICTGCGAGAMKGPMKGAAIGHLKQHNHGGRHIGISEPGIIASESPNPVVNELVIMPDIEKRLEAFVRFGHGFIIFPGGVGTLEEILFLLGVLMHPENQDLPFPLIFTAPASSVEYFAQIDDFLVQTLGVAVRKHYQIIIADPQQVAIKLTAGIKQVYQYRQHQHDAFYFNWRLHIPYELQQPFDPSHANMAALTLRTEMPVAERVVNLRRVLSGIVAGNVKENGIRQIQQYGPFQLQGDPEIMQPLDKILERFVAENRMKLPGNHYEPCYQLISLT